MVAKCAQVQFESVSGQVSQSRCTAPGHHPLQVPFLLIDVASSVAGVTRVSDVRGHVVRQGLPALDREPILS